MKKDCLLLVLIALFNLTGCERPKAPEACGPVPTEAQLKWQELERYAFIHFSMNTFTDMEWGYGDKDPQLFNPSELDCRQWCELFKEAGVQRHGCLRCEGVAPGEGGVQTCGCRSP